MSRSVPIRRWLLMLLVVGMVCQPSLLIGQCANNNTAIAGGAVTPPCPGTMTIPCVQGGQYALLNVTAGNIYTFNTCSAGFDTQITLYNNTGGGSLGYNDDACGLQSTVAWTATFTGQLRVLVDQYNCATNGVCAPLEISCMPPPPPMTNNNCGTAIDLPVFSFCLPQTFTNVGSTNSGAPIPICSYTVNARDVWFRFVAPASGRVVIESSAVTLNDGVMQLYGGACGGLATVECDDDDGPGLMPLINTQCDPLTPGATYYIRYWGYGTAQGIFTLCVRSLDVSTPQEDCSGGFTICSNQTFNNNTTWTGCTQDLNVSNQDCLLSNEQQGTWYFFSPNTAGTIGFTIDPAANIDYDFALWGPMGAITCPPAGLPIRCSYASGFSTFNATGSYNTGLGNGAGDTSENAAGNGWVAPINVLAGQIYILYIDNFSSTAQSFDLNWNLSTPGMLDCTVLPVELLAFTGQRVGAQVRLEWTTVSEINSSHFIVERSTDGQHFQAIGELPAAGWSTTTMQYQLLDPSPGTGITYYRLQQADLDGSNEYSHVVAVEDPGHGARIAVIPNPAQGPSRVELTGLPQASRWTILDPLGRPHRTGGTSGAPSFDLDLTGLGVGSYLLEVSDADGRVMGLARFMVY